MTAPGAPGGTGLPGDPGNVPPGTPDGGAELPGRGGGPSLPGAPGGPGGPALPDGEPGVPGGPALPDGEPGVPGGSGHARGGPGRGEPGLRPSPRQPEPERRPQASEPPEPLVAARVLWIAAALFGLLCRLLDATTASWGSLPSSARKPYEEMASGAGLDPGQAATLFTAQRVVYAVMAFVLVAATLVLARLMLRGKWWARAVLDVAGAFAVFSAIMVAAGMLMGLAPDGGRDEVVTFLVLAFEVLAGLCAGVAVWRQHDTESDAYLGAARERRR